jgi:hypothetical protein
MLAGASDANGDDLEVSTPAEARAAVRAIRKAMSNSKVPSGDRFMAVNPDFADLLIDGLSDAAVAGGTEELRNGQILRLYGFTIVETPLIDAAVPAAIGYHNAMIAYANQINSLEALRNPTKFADIVRGLNVYGAKVIKSEAVVKFVGGAAS